MSRIDIEDLALERGIKPVRRIAIDPGERARAIGQAAARGLAIVEAERLASIGGRERALFYLARDIDGARAARDAERDVLPGGPPTTPDAAVLEAHRRTGAALGYPPCCVDAFLGRIARGVTTRAFGGSASEEFVALEDALARTRAAPDARLNVLRRREFGALIAFHPCALDCELALDLAARTLDALTEQAPDFATSLVHALTAPISLAPSDTASSATALRVRFG